MEYALKMEEWSDAFKASDIIFILINKQDKKIVKGHLESFFTDLAQIFWKSDHHLFHSYALMNVHPIIMKGPQSALEKATMSAELVFSALSVSLTNRLSNFERLSTNYLPKEIQNQYENSGQVTQEILQVS